MISARVHGPLCNPMFENSPLANCPKSTMLLGAYGGVVANMLMNLDLKKGASYTATAIGDVLGCSEPIKICQTALGIIT